MYKYEGKQKTNNYNKRNEQGNQRDTRGNRFHHNRR
jgi:hypothetical protein